MKDRFKKVIVVDREEWDKILHWAAMYEKDEGKLRSNILQYIQVLEEDPKRPTDALFILKHILKS